MMFFLNNFLILENGYIFNCKIINKKNVFGELIFNTSNYGYIENISDPSYKNQILILSNPHIGNMGWIHQDCQSYTIKLNAIIINNYSISSNFRSKQKLFKFLKKPIIFDIDTRFLISIVRNSGSQFCYFYNFKNIFFVIKYLRCINKKKIFYD